MAKRKKKVPETIDPNELKTRDPLIVVIILGATKAGVHKDRKKEKNRKACRSKDLED